MAAARANGSLVTGPIVLAELARYATGAAGLSELAADLKARIEPWSLEASWLAGRAYLQYRARGGGREAILGDFLIGGHAASIGATILTRDPRRFRAYFPELEIIAPEAENG